MSREPSPWRLVVLAALASAVAQSFGRFTYPLVLTAVQRDLGFSYTVAGAIGSANLVAYMVGTAAVTWLATRWLPAHMVRGGVALSVAGLGFAAIAQTPLMLGVAMFITGFAGAVIWVPAPAVGTARLPMNKRGLGYGLVGSGIGIGFVISGLLAGRLRAQLGDPAWRVVYRWEVVAGLVILIALLAWLRPTGASVRGGVRLSAIRGVPGYPWLLAAYAAFGLSYSLMATYLVAMLEDDRGFDPVLASQMFLILGIGTIPGGPLIGRISDSLGRPRVMAGAFAVMAAAAVTLRWAPIAAVIPALVLFGIAFSGIPTTIAAHVGDHTEPGEFAAAFGVATLAFGLTQMVAPQVGGVLADTLGGFEIVFLLSAVIAVLGFVASAVLQRRELPSP